LLKYKIQYIHGPDATILFQSLIQVSINI
jgi:hypothetical protein